MGFIVQDRLEAPQKLNAKQWPMGDQARYRRQPADPILFEPIGANVDHQVANLVPQKRFIPRIADIADDGLALVLDA
jgi:hypothetical protein